MRKRATSIVAATRVTTTLLTPIGNYGKLGGLAIKESHGAKERTQHMRALGTCARARTSARARVSESFA